MKIDTTRSEISTHAQVTGRAHSGEADFTALPVHRGGEGEPLLLRLAHRLFPEPASPEIRPSTDRRQANGKPGPEASIERTSADKPVPAPHHTHTHTHTHTHVCSDGVICGPWRAWRESDDASLTSVLHVSGTCRLPVERIGSSLVLEEAALPLEEALQWGDLAGGAPLLLLERVLIPPPFDAPPPDKNAISADVPITFQRVETFDRPPTAIAGGLTWAARPRHTHVGILPDSIAIPIEDLRPTATSPLPQQPCPGGRCPGYQKDSSKERE